jgi:VacB/RNase II family 3'-5' exoribonuclease
MAQQRTTISGGDLSQALTTLRRDLELPDAFPPDVQAEAGKEAGESHIDGHVDATDLELVTLDPAGSRDLDQAFALTRRAGGGYDFAYAIADVAAFVTAGGAIDREAHVRGETLYLPDGRIPLHPAVLSEGAASLLPGQDRPAVLWRIQLDADGEPTSVEVRRSVVRSRAQLDYVSLQQQGGEVAELLREVGLLRQQREHDRGGVSLAEPEQQVERAGDGWELSYRAPLPVEDYNAQLSLLTGMAAAKLMLDGKVGLLRTMPPPSDATVASLRRSAGALGIDWPKGATYIDVVRRLDPKVPAQAAMIRLAAVLFRGASYVAFDGEPPQLATHAAVAASYAHATAPLRRLADRYVSETCLALCANSEVPGWVREALPALPEQMAEADRRAHEVDRAVIDLAEALVLQHHVGEVFCGVVVDAGDKGGAVQLAEPAVRARLTGAGLPLGEQVDVRVTGVDVVRRRVDFALA